MTTVCLFFFVIGRVLTRLDRTSPERPTGPKPTPPCSQRLRRRGRLRELYEPRARLPVRPGGLCRRRLDGTLSVTKSSTPLGGGSENVLNGAAPQIELGGAFTLIYLWVTSRPITRYCALAGQQLPWHPAHGHMRSMANGQPNEEPDCESSCSSHMSPDGHYLSPLLCGWNSILRRSLRARKIGPL